MLYMWFFIWLFSNLLSSSSALVKRSHGQLCLGCARVVLRYANSRQIESTSSRKCSAFLSAQMHKIDPVFALWSYSVLSWAPDLQLSSDPCDVGLQVVEVIIVLYPTKGFVLYWLSFNMVFYVIKKCFDVQIHIILGSSMHSCVFIFSTLALLWHVSFVMRKTFLLVNREKK